MYASYGRELSRERNSGSTSGAVTVCCLKKDLGFAVADRYVYLR